MTITTQNYVKLALILCLLLLTVYGLFLWQDRLMQSAQHFTSFLTTTQLLAGDQLTRLSSQVVVVIVGGVGYDALSGLDLPNIQRLQESGANALIESRAPSYNEPSWLALLSGVEPALNMGARLGAFPNHPFNQQVDTVFHRLQDQDQTIVFIGTEEWQPLIPQEISVEATFTPIADGTSDVKIIRAAEDALDANTFNLMVLYLGQVNSVGLSKGLNHPDYRQAILQVDHLLGQLQERIDFAQTTVIITSDHGHIEQGGYGGQDFTVLRQPLIMVGKQIIPGTYSSVDQEDIAPTISTLLGTSIPRANQGRPLLEMIRISNEAEAQAFYSLAQQRLSLTKAYLQFMNSATPTFSEIEDAGRFFANKNYAGTTELSQLLITQATEAQQQATQSRLSSEKRWRFVLVIGLGIIFGLFVLWHITSLWLYNFLAALVVFGSYQGFYLLLGQPYSFSSVFQIDALWTQTSLVVIGSLLVGGCVYLALLALQQVNDVRLVLLSSFEWIFFSMLIFLANVAYGFWRVGFWITWHFPDMGHLFLYYTALIQTIWIGMFGLLVPFIVVLINFFIQKLIMRYQTRKIINAPTKASV
ncbi:MAG: alkaline phosphatase family protein [Chloroflexota bacterium]